MLFLHLLNSRLHVFCCGKLLVGRLALSHVSKLSKQQHFFEYRICPIYANSWPFLKGELSSFTTVCAEFTNHLFGCNFQLANAVLDFIKTNRIPNEMIVDHKIHFTLWFCCILHRENAPIHCILKVLIRMFASWTEWDQNSTNPRKIFQNPHQIFKI